MDNRNEAISKLKSLTGKRYIYFFDSGDDAIFWVMNHLKDRGFKKILIPGSGGWFSYRKYPKKLGLDVIEIKTIDSLIDVEDTGYFQVEIWGYSINWRYLSIYWRIFCCRAYD